MKINLSIRCPECELKREHKKIWDLLFNQDYDLWKSENDKRLENEWLKEAPSIINQIMVLTKKNQLLEEKIEKQLPKEYMELRKINSELAFLQNRLNYHKKVSYDPNH